MAQTSWIQSFVNLLERNAVALSPELYLEFSRQCLAEVRMKTLRRDSKSSEVINYEQCISLVDSLDKAVQKASLFVEHNRDHGGNSMSTEDGKESPLEHLKILCMLAKKVKWFIQGCCHGPWLHAAFMLTNLSHCTASLGVDLKLFTVLLPPFSASPCTLSPDEVSALRENEDEFVKKMASKYEARLFTKLRALIQYGQASSDDLALATFLLERLDRFKQSLPSITSGSLKLILPERDLSNLKDMVRIGGGGSGTVYKASWLGIDVAAKTYCGSDNPEFNHKVSILAGLSHPNIVSFLCHGKDLGECLTVMELMDRDLFSLLKERLRNDRTRSSPFSVYEEFDLILQIAEAMDYLHKMRVWHRNLKSENILVRCLKSPNAEGYESVQVKVSGFGLSRTMDFGITRYLMTPNVGTARWMAPELIKFPNTNDIRDIGTAKSVELAENYPDKCDVYSFGIVCSEILIGDLPFPNLKPTEVKRAVCAGERPRIPDRCHEKLKALIEACWNPEASSRPCFGDICSELRHLKSLHMTPLSPVPYVKFSRQCLEEARTMTSPRESKSSEVINYEQCIYLVDSLDKAVHKASLFLEYNGQHGGNSISSEDVRENTLELFKILCMLAKKVKWFIQGCCHGHWRQVSVMLTNLSHCTASLGFDLKLFTVLLPPFSASPCTLSPDEVTALRKNEGELVKKMASNDEDRLFTKLRALIEDGQLSSDDFELATILLERLDRFKQSLPSITSGSLKLTLPERDLSNLKDMVHIGRGGYGTVYKASWLGIDVAAKIFYGAQNEDFTKEALIVTGLSHPNIVSFLCHGKDREECFIVMELMDRDLFSLLKERLRNNRTRSSPFSVYEEFDVILQIAEAMDYLHEMRVLHRDLKSHNILVRCLKSPNVEGYESVQVKVSDFGLSRTKECSMSQSQMTPNAGTAR